MGAFVTRNAKIIQLQTQQQTDVDALCEFHCGISNWPSSGIVGWDCASSCPYIGGTATTAPCGTGALTTTTWTGVTCSGGGSSGQVSELSLGSLSLTGTISSSLSAITGLIYIDLSSNMLSNSIPSQMSSLTNMQYLFLNQNLLTGSIPTHISSMAALQSLWLFQNALTGTVGSFTCLLLAPPLIGGNSFSCINSCIASMLDNDPCGTSFNYDCATPLSSNCGDPTGTHLFMSS
jgi:hypothetical protein